MDNIHPGEPGAVSLNSESWADGSPRGWIELRISTRETIYVDSKYYEIWSYAGKSRSHKQLKIDEAETMELW